MSNNTIATLDVNQVMEKVLIAGDLSHMDPKDRIQYYLQTCNSMGMNPMTKPFDLITLNGKMVLYPNRSGTDQLRKIGNVDITLIENRFDKETGCYIVKARAKLPSGRTDEDMGIVPCSNAKGEQLANAQLKAVTKAKRRVTLSIMGLGWIDESEVGSVKDAKLHRIDLETGSMIDVAQPLPGPQKSIVGNPTQSEEVLRVMNQEITELKKEERRKIGNLYLELGITVDEVMEEVIKRFQIKEVKNMSLEQLKETRVWLETRLEEKVIGKALVDPMAASQPELPGGDFDQMPPWGK